MHRIKEVIVVEGRYDKNALSQVVNATIIETSGFGIFNNTQKQKLLRKLAETRGLIVLTDSDGAGLVIRNFIRSTVDKSLVKHAYTPEIKGKERRKAHSSREGKLGVEGMRPQILLDALIKSGATVDGVENTTEHEPITKADMFRAGLSGGENSREKRLALMHRLELPEKISADALLDVLNALMTREEFFTVCDSTLQQEQTVSFPQE